MSGVNVPAIGFIYWWRAAPRKKNAFFYFAMSTWLALYVGVAALMLSWTPARPWTFVLVLGFICDLYLVRHRLPRWAWPFPRGARDAWLYDSKVQAASALREPVDPLTDPYDAASSVGRHAPPPDQEATLVLRARIAPMPSAKRLRRACDDGARKARAQLGVGERLRVRGDLTEEGTSIALDLAGPAASAQRLREIAPIFEEALRRELPDREIAIS